jgi:predicted Mrr-cat superfamily restriction endonuclease
MIWLHRISHCAAVSYPLLEKEYLSIGWSDFSTAEFIEKSCGENGGKYFDATIQDKHDCLPRGRWSLWYFIHDMKKGDRVIVPTAGAFSVFEIEEDKALSIGEIRNLGVEIKDWSGNLIETDERGYLYNPSEKKVVDLGFFRKVKPKAIAISRYDYADAALTARMKIRQTTAAISDLKDSVEKALLASNAEKPLSIYSQIVDKTRQPILDTIKSELSDGKLEYLAKWYFERIGATNVYIPAKNERDKEGDADVVATFEPIKTIIYTQVKFHEGETSPWAIEQITNYKLQKEKEGMDDGYSKIAWVISTCDRFSEEARNMAKEAKIQLFDGATFATMLLEAGIANMNGSV